MEVVDEATAFASVPGGYAIQVGIIEDAIRQGPPYPTELEIAIGGEKVQAARKVVWEILRGIPACSN
jgi:hypothetical protein